MPCELAEVGEEPLCDCKMETEYTKKVESDLNSLTTDYEKDMLSCEKDIMRSLDKQKEQRETIDGLEEKVREIELAKADLEKKHEASIAELNG